MLDQCTRQAGPAAGVRPDGSLVTLCCGTTSKATSVAIAILKSFDRDHGLAIIKLDGEPSEVAIRVVGSDRSVLSAVSPGQRICFDIGRDRRGRTLAVDVRP